MRTIEFDIIINRPLQEVFDFMANPENDVKWQKGLISSEWITPGPPAPGSKKQVVIRFMGMKIEAPVNYLTWESPNTYSFEANSGPFSVAATTNFEATENGTQVSTKGQMQGKGVFKLIEGLAANQAKKDDLANYKKLKTILEAG